MKSLIDGAVNVCIIVSQNFNLNDFSTKIIEMVTKFIAFFGSYTLNVQVKTITKV